VAQWLNLLVKAKLNYRQPALWKRGEPYQRPIAMNQRENPKGKLVADVSGNHRTIFEPNHDPVPIKENGGPDWKLVADVPMLAIGEGYH